ncbi:hypothetical protein DP939_07040 [Spongiactinospora rosea]|uniref:Uncharacterized protein n=1 Tax=Spongiactinospora rosea TaxID=2248750 RepID=A0A366M3Q3_9ACTN|nr:hypothetical protein [Spongiactinospora rosea]RBQ20825.1 hypothetical protein DP939_07040 [Spongiactinospora rosea]
MALMVQIAKIGTGGWLRIWDDCDETSTGVHVSRTDFTRWLTAVKEGKFAPDRYKDLLRLHIGDLIAGPRSYIVTTGDSWSRFVLEARRGAYDEFRTRM